MYSDEKVESSVFAFDVSVKIHFRQDNMTQAVRAIKARPSENTNKLSAPSEGKMHNMCLNFFVLIIRYRFHDGGGLFFSQRREIGERALFSSETNPTCITLALQESIHLLFNASSSSLPCK